MIVVIIPLIEGKFIMVFNPRRGWEFPGGKVEQGETPRQAAMRECMEEAGIVFENLEILEKDEDMFVFWGKVKNVEGGEMVHKVFSELPKDLAFSKKEAQRFLRKLHIYT